jgi:hypothetical protein
MVLMRLQRSLRSCLASNENNKFSLLKTLLRVCATVEMAFRGIQSRILHRARELNPASSVMAPIYQTATYQIPSPEAGAEFALTTSPPQFYTRYGSPNNKQAVRCFAHFLHSCLCFL